MLKKFLNHFGNEVTPVELVEAEKEKEKVSEEQKPYDYGLDSLSFCLWTDDYGWNIDQEYKKVFLTNPHECKEKISVTMLISAWRGTGHSEWEFLMAGWFVKAVVEAIEKGYPEAEITPIFNRDFLASRGRVFTKEQVYNHIIRFFDIVEDTDDVLKLKLHI